MRPLDDNTDSYLTSNFILRDTTKKRCTSPDYSYVTCWVCSSPGKLLFWGRFTAAHSTFSLHDGAATRDLWRILTRPVSADHASSYKYLFCPFLCPPFLNWPFSCMWHFLSVFSPVNAIPPVKQIVAARLEEYPSNFELVWRGKCGVWSVQHEISHKVYSRLSSSDPAM